MKIKMLMIVAVVMAAAVPVDKAFAQATADDKKAKKAKRMAQFPDMSVADVQAAIKGGKVTILDVNGMPSYKSGHLPGALHFASVHKVLAKTLPEDKAALIVAYCSGPN